jgi:heptosyltransferase-1
MRILIVKPSSFGDIVMTLPALALLRRKHPDAEIGWFVNAEFAGLLDGHPMLAWLHRWDRGRRGTARGLLRGAGALGPVAREMRACAYDVAYDFQGLFRSGLATRRSGAPVRIGFRNGRELSPFFYTERRATPPSAVHAVDRYRSLVDPQSADPAEFPLAIGEEADAAARALLRELGLAPDEKFLAVNAGARWQSKQWPPERFGQVAARIRRRNGLRSVCIGTPGFRVASRAVAAVAGDAVLDATGRTSLKELAALLHNAVFLLTNDSGPMHLAVAAGTPVVALFGPTDPALVGPYGPGHEVLRVEVECAPCSKRDCPERPPCMTMLGVKPVAEACERMLDRLRA